MSGDLGATDDVEGLVAGVVDALVDELAEFLARLLRIEFLNEAAHRIAVGVDEANVALAGRGTVAPARFLEGFGVGGAEAPPLAAVGPGERPGEVVTRDELRRRLWDGDTFVDYESGLNTAANRLRLKLGDSADTPRYIETLARTGYRFIAPIERIDWAPPSSPPAPRRAARWLRRSPG